MNRADLAKAEAALQPVLPELGDSVTMSSESGIAKLSVVGIGMRSHAGVAAEMFEILSQAGANIQMISTSEIKITVTVAEDQIETAAKAIHDRFGLAAE